MDVTSDLWAVWFLWFRGALLAAAGFLLCHRRNYAAIAAVLLAAYWAYNSISPMIEYRTEVAEQMGLSYMVQAYIALLMPFAAMILGLLWKGRKSGSPHRVPNGASDSVAEQHTSTVDHLQRNKVP